MTHLRPDVRLSWVALAAVMGLLSVAGEASAAGKACSCCAKRVCSMGCCRGPIGPSGPETAVPPAALAPVRGGLTSLPAVPCECRSDVPAEPASKPEIPTADPRAEQDQIGSVALSIETSRPAVFAPVSAPAFGLSRAPLLLNTTRLLI
jgi:hypothetical protein